MRVEILPLASDQDFFIPPPTLESALCAQLIEKWLTTGWNLLGLHICKSKFEQNMWSIDIFHRNMPSHFLDHFLSTFYSSSHQPFDVQNKLFCQEL